MMTKKKQGLKARSNLSFETASLLPPLGFPFPVKSQNYKTGNAKPETVFQAAALRINKPEG
jgi:hypothetical protein